MNTVIIAYSAQGGWPRSVAAQAMPDRAYAMLYMVLIRAPQKNTPPVGGVFLPRKGLTFERWEPPEEVCRRYRPEEA
jgi:hypothetical protein